MKKILSDNAILAQSPVVCVVGSSIASIALTLVIKGIHHALLLAEVCVLIVAIPSLLMHVVDLSRAQRKSELGEPSDTHEAE